MAAHARGTIRHWQILNERSLIPAFAEAPEEYRRLLSASSDAIKRAAPEEKVVAGNVYVNPSDEQWAAASVRDRRSRPQV